MPIGRAILFVSIMTLALFGLHTYVCLRFVRALALGPAEQRLVKMIFAALFVVLWLSFPLERVLPRAVASPLLWGAFTWLGTVVLFSVVFGLGDAGRLLVWLALRGGMVDETRRAWLFRCLDVAALGGGAVLSGLSVVQGLRKPKVRQVEVVLDKLPKALSGFRIVQLTDVHIGPTLDGLWLSQLVEQVNALSADVVAITGDLVDGSVSQLRQHVAPLSGLRARHGVFFVTGNHEYYSGVEDWLTELTRLGLRVLRNERVTLTVQTSSDTTAVPSSIDLLGVDDFHAGMFPGHGPDLARAAAGRDPQRTALLLAHQPAQIDEAERLGIDLQLSGHTHAGQIWPWGFLVRLQQPYVWGLHRQGPTQIYVSAGCGFWGPPMRLGSDNELTLIILKSA